MFPLDKLGILEAIWHVYLIVTCKEFGDNDGVEFAVEGLDKGHNLGTPTEHVFIRQHIFIFSKLHELL